MVYKVILHNATPAVELLALNLHTGENHVVPFKKIGELLAYLNEKGITVTLSDTVLA